VRLLRASGAAVVSRACAGLDHGEGGTAALPDAMSFFDDGFTARGDAVLHIDT